MSQGAVAALTGGSKPSRKSKAKVGGDIVGACNIFIIGHSFET